MPSWSRYVLTPVLLLLPGFAFASSIEINSTCVLGTCPPASGPTDAVQLGQSVGPTTGTYSLAFGNGDQYLISWTFSASYDANRTRLSVDPMATYVGVDPSIGNDLITFQFFQNFYGPGPGTWDGSYTETVPLSLSLTAGAGSTVSGQLSYDGQPMGLIGPHGPGDFLEQNTMTLSGLTDNTLASIFVFNFDFHQGTTANTTASAASVTVADVPEPAQALPLGIAFLGAAYRLATRRRRNRAR